jgi:purine nucleosidase
VAARGIIIDCDPGKDDALALLLAAASPAELELIAVTTVAGNVPLALTSRNARAVLELAGCLDVPVHAGRAGPLRGTLVTAEHVHGDGGLGSLDLPEPRLPLAGGDAAGAIIAAVMERPPGTVTLCPLGPLTNLAVAFGREPGLAGRLAGIALMGGARDLGNATPAAEFNILVDPEAAAVIFASGAPITMFGLEVTHHVRATVERRRRFEALPGPIGRAAASLLAEDVPPVDDPAPGPALHDPCPIAWLVAPHLFSGRTCRVEIETEGRWCRGRTVVDWHGRSGRPANALVMDRADAHGVFDLMLERLGRLRPP